ncbi:hypothetical protein [Neoroseomonas lacus]|uniref:Uncharacterized protein n=1 Tax=Neoroseomonas lacus TaxID=287609 RepID=A0A917NZD3_9PROT|nr:hypothetical protein [Neoroseomonas lacus]GGJ39610.1 hypothetical protein GCM10011320_54070 [Neoroseomonas lacus]
MDGLDIEIEGDSEAAVALALLKIVMRAEGKGEDGADADWILATYRRCLAAVVGAFEFDEQDPEDSDEGEEDEEAVGEAAN